MTKSIKNVSRTSSGLRNALFDELDDLRSGKSTPHKANATANLSRSIIELVRVEVDVARISANVGKPLVSLQTNIDLG